MVQDLKLLESILHLFVSFTVIGFGTYILINIKKDKKLKLANNKIRMGKKITILSIIILIILNTFILINLNFKESSFFDIYYSLTQVFVILGCLFLIICVLILFINAEVIINE